MTLINCGVFIAGLGGLGGYLLEHMLRLGPGFIRAADGDVFDETNLDRQLLSAPSQLGRPKAEAAAERAKLVAPGLDFEAVSEFLDGENCLRLLRGCAQRSRLQEAHIKRLSVLLGSSLRCAIRPRQSLG